MKRKNIVITAALLLSLSLASCASTTSGTTSSYDDAAKLLTEVKTTQFFSEESIPTEDVDKILSAGVNAPSAMNSQPWHFTAVTDKEVAAKLADAMSSMKPPATGAKDSDMPFMPPSGQPGNMPTPPAGAPEGKGSFSKAPNKAGIGDAPLTIVISCNQGSELDAGLAVQNMSAEAQLLGYGAKIMTAPTMALNNDEYKTLLNIPEGQKIVAVLIVGKAAPADENSDAVSSATTRNSFEEVVTIIAE